MYYDTIEAAISAAPNCTHVLTTGPEWDLDSDIRGMFEPAVYTEHEGVMRYLHGVDQSLHDGSRMSDSAWVVALDRTIAPGTACTTPKTPAHEFLERGAKHMRDRAEQRDSEDGERSMASCVAAFNALEGTELTEAQGWRFMVLLKYARSVNGVFVGDDYEDMAAYAGLAGECASIKENQ